MCNIKKIYKRKKIKISSDFVMYLQEFDIEVEKDPKSFLQVIN